MNELNKLINQTTSKFKADSKIKECFHYDSDSCDEKIKNAHSLQKNGVLSILEHEVNKNQVVYSFLHPKPHGFMTYYGFEPIGKKEASTFHGFCDIHDSTIFSPIENKPVDINSDEHCFLLSYRAFAKEYHSKIETHKGYTTNDFFNLPQNKQDQDGMINGTNLAIRDLKEVKIKLNKLLETKDFQGLEYFSYSINQCIPVACSASITPAYSYNGTLLNKSIKEDVIYENVFLSVLPTKTETHVIFACFPEDKKSQLFISELESLSDDELEIAITSILIGDIENTFISPLIWEKMTKKEKEQLMKEISLTAPPYSYLNEDFFLSKINLFNKKFRK